jgi:4-hydroxy-3-methylbut-2-enyl diphosphate reductase
MIKIEIDNKSGFCFGVVNAIESAERALDTNGALYCLGDLVHNSHEMERLKRRGLQTIDHAALMKLQNKTVLLRAHGEPPSTYEVARRNDITIVDATCPVVKRLQGRIKKRYNEIKDSGAQLVIYGKQGHAEVNGLVGQTEGTAIVVETADDLNRLDFTKEIALFSQTTKSLDGFAEMVEAIKRRMTTDVKFQYFDTICRRVANRMPDIKSFAARHDCVYFVAGQKSSNGKILFDECLKSNSNTFFISSANDIKQPLPSSVQSVGVCGATSTPKWLMEEVAARIQDINGN